MNTPKNTARSRRRIAWRKRLAWIESAIRRGAHDAREAQRWGVVDEVVDPALDLADAAWSARARARRRFDLVALRARRLEELSAEHELADRLVAILDTSRVAEITDTSAGRVQWIYTDGVSSILAVSRNRMGLNRVVWA